MQRVKRMFKKLMSKKQNGDSLFVADGSPPSGDVPLFGPGDTLFGPAGPGLGINII